MVDYNTAPLNADLYSRIMVEAYADKPSITTAFQSFFGRSENGSQTLYSPDSESLEIEIQRPTKNLAATVHRGQFARSLGDNQKAVQVDRWTNITRVYPLIEEVGNLNASQLLRRIFNESGYTQMTSKFRLQKLALKMNEKLLGNIYRTQEVMASQSILTGKMPAMIGTSDVDLLYDFYRNSDHQMTLTTQWTNIAADALNDLDEACDFIRINGNLKADMAIMGKTALKWFQLNTALLAKSDNLTFEKNINDITNAMPAKYRRFIDAGLQLRFHVITPQGNDLYIFGYKGYYVDSSSVVQEYMPAEKVIVASSDARCDRYFGPPERLPLSTADRQLYQDYFGVDINSGPPAPPKVEDPGAVIARGSFYFDAIRDQFATTLQSRVQSAPIFATTATDGFAVILNAA